MSQGGPTFVIECNDNCISLHSNWLRIRLLPVFFLFTNKDDERLTRWKEKLLGCVESDLSGSKVLLLDRGKDNNICFSL
ncbi:hypothetical protein L1987_00554 [Smallanthus sonchifolius]|uniref:Uncharacterized protein n=1 Tax=Smallanthus sonchifolius TaxID=185202 RepID=A0ACB9K2L2_9ASTR|nr:hypothetical protein L1987_00554 [Smallanthus sonchifolius]